MTAGPNWPGVQEALDFLVRLTPEEVRCAGLSASPDCREFAAMARARGFQIDADSVEQAFRLLMRARLLRSRAISSST